MKKVLLITDNYCLEEVDGRFYHRCLDDHIRAYGILGSVTLCVPIRHTISINRPVDMTDVRVVEIWKENNIYRRFINRRDNKKIIAEEVKKADIIVGFIPSSVSDLAARYAKKYKKTFLAVVIASAWDILWNHSLKGKFMAPISHFSTRRTIRDAEYSIYVTEQYLQNKYPTKGISSAISDVVINPLEKQVLENRVQKIRSKQSNKVLSILSIGAVDVKYKGQEEVIEAISVLSYKGYNIDYYLIGSGDKKRLYKIANKLGVADKVHFIGGLPHEDVFSYFKAIDIYIQPSRTEGLPRAVVEAMSYAVPVICSNIGGMPELVEKDCLYKSGDIQDLCLKILRMSESSDTMIRKAKYNFTKAAAFQEDSLYAKRKEFIINIQKQ